MFETKMSSKYMLKFVFKYKWYFTKTRIIITTYLFKNPRNHGLLDNWISISQKSAISLPKLMRI